MQVLKYKIEDIHQNIEMPRGAVPVSFQIQSGVLVLWCVADPDAEKVERELSVVGTGQDLPSGKQTYVGTAQSGALVWHLFDGGEV